MNYFGENNQKRVFFKTFSNDLLLKYNLKKEDYLKNLNIDFDERITNINELLVLSQPNIIKEITERYLKAGIDFIGTLSDRANNNFLKKLDLEEYAYDINFNASKIVRELTVKYSTLNLNHKRYTIGCIEDTEKSLKNTDIYFEQIKTLISGKADLIYLKSFNDYEKIYDLLVRIDNLMQKRNKEIDIILCFDFNEDIDIFDKNNIILSKTNIIAKGITIETNQIELLKNYNHTFISFSNNNNSQIDKIGEIIKNNKSIKIINLHNGFIPDNIERIIQLAQ